MSMRDVTSRATALMRESYGSEEYFRRLWEMMGQRHWNGIPIPEWIVLDKSAKDGFRAPFLADNDRAITTETQAGRIFVLERDRGTTTLFFVWVPPDLALTAKESASVRPIDYHVLFHANPHADMYNVPYWTGVFSERDKSGKKSTTPSFVLLGTRYLFYDFRALAQHLLARTTMYKRLMLVVPVASNQRGYFSDLHSPDALVAACREIGDFVRGNTSTDETVGQLMLTGYSYSGHVIERILQDNVDKPEHQGFFTSRLAQITLMDIHLADDSQERLAKFKALWHNAYKIKEKLNRGLILRAYTAYRDHADHMRNYRGDGTGPMMEYDLAVNLDSVEWSDIKLKRGTSRGTALQFYNGDLSLAVLHFPTTFFYWYVDEVRNPSGFDSGEGHGHGWLLRTFLSHALFRRQHVSRQHPADVVEKSKR